MKHEIIQFESVMWTRRDALRANEEFDIRIGDERNVNSVSDREGGMRVLVSRDSAPSVEPGHHGTQYSAPCRVVSAQHSLHHGLRLRSQQVPAVRPRDRDFRPASTEEQNDGLRLRVDVVVGLTSWILAPSLLRQ